MTCKVKSCSNDKVLGYRYCEEHLCRITKNNCRCKNKKFQNSSFCFLHHYSINKSSIFLSLIAILSFLFGLYGVYMSPPVYNYFNGKLIIDFDENNIKPNENGVDSVKIEVINKLGKPLSHVNGISILTCQNFDGKIQSKVFKLEGGYNFLGDDGHAEFFLSPDPLFVNLVSSRNHKCVDAYFIDAKYHKINKSYAKLEKVTTYDFFINESGDYKIVNSRLNNIDYITKHKCTKCNITIKIFSQNHKPETHKESHKFVGSSITIPPFEKEIFLNDGDDYSEVFSKSLIGYYIPGTNATELCKKIKEGFNIGINCNQHMGGFRIPSLPFYRTKIASIEEGQSSRVIQIDYITE